MDGQTIFLCLKTPDQTLAGGTLVLVVFSDIDEIPLAKTALGYAGRHLRLWQIGRDPGFITGQNLFTFKVSTIGNHIEFIGADGLFGLS